MARFNWETPGSGLTHWGLGNEADAAAAAEDLGLECHAGHGLSYDNVGPVAAIPNLMELNIGHFLIGEAIFGGLDSAIKRMRSLMDRARAAAQGEESA